MRRANSFWVKPKRRRTFRVNSATSRSARSSSSRAWRRRSSSDAASTRAASIRPFGRLVKPCFISVYLSRVCLSGGDDSDPTRPDRVHDDEKSSFDPSENLIPALRVAPPSVFNDDLAKIIEHMACISEIESTLQIARIALAFVPFKAYSHCSPVNDKVVV